MERGLKQVVQAAMTGSDNCQCGFSEDQIADDKLLSIQDLLAPVFIGIKT